MGDEPPALERAFSPIPGRVEHRGNLTVTLGPVRQLLWGARTPLVYPYTDGTIILASSRRIVSRNWGETWRPVEYPQVHANTLELHNGSTLMIEYDPKPVEGKPGSFTVTRWTSSDKGLTVQGPFSDGELVLPAEKFATGTLQWFHGNSIEMPDNSLLAAMQGQEAAGPPKGPWKTYVVKSIDGGKTWTYLADVASRETLKDPDDRLKKSGWDLYFAVEPNLIHLGNGELVCVMRSANDEAPNMPTERVGAPSEEYRDLWYTVPGTGIHSSLMKLDGEKFYPPGPANAPLIIAYSHDGGRTWVEPQPMRQARGCFPRMAYSDGVLALTYGGLSGVPRWGNAIAFSLDGGKTWTDEIVFGPTLTTGYTGVVATGPGKFLCFFDCTPPQPWTNEAAWWIGAVDVTVERN